MATPLQQTLIKDLTNEQIIEAFEIALQSEPEALWQADMEHFSQLYDLACERGFGEQNALFGMMVALQDAINRTTNG